MNELVNSKRNELFQTYFGVSEKFFQDMEISALLGRYEFDVIKFDDWCHTEHGYDEDTHGS